MSWEIRKFGDVVDKIVGGGTPSKNKSEYWEGDIYWVSVKDMSEGKYSLSETQDTISQEGLNNSSANLIPEGTLIISTRMGLGRAFINTVPMAINQDLKAIYPNTEYVDNDFLLWNYISKAALIENMGNGATVKGIRLEQLKSIEIDLPPLQTQKRIANILSAYDDLIENNLKRIKLLEEVAQNIYKEWFVSLRFPGYENTSINEETGLPEGWKRGVISDFGKVVTGKTPSTKRSDFYGGHIPFIKTPDMHGLPYVIETNNNLTELGQQAQLNKNLPANSVLVSCIGTAGVVAMTSKISQTNQQINSVVFESTFKSYYFYCFAKTLRPLLEGLGSNGATMVNVNKGKFENVDLNIPTESLLIEYAKIAEPMFNQILTLSIQNQKLKAARDILLPRLMNRTIEV